MKNARRFIRYMVFGALAIVLAVPSMRDSASFVGESSVISGASEQEQFPSLAYNSQNQEYLAVWFNDRAGCDDIRAQRITKRGDLIGNPFYISADCSAERRYPDVTYNSAHNQYLVVWEQYVAASGYSIKARRISGNGQVQDLTDLTIRGSGYNLYTPQKPVVSYASTSDRYLVVWAETFHPAPITHEIVGQVVTETGSLEGTGFSIAQNSHSLEEPDVAYNRHANRYLVVWQQDAGALWDIHGQQVHGGGGKFQGDITIAYYTKSSMAPAVASIPTSPTDDKFLVVWELDYAPSDRDIYARLVAEDGTPGQDFWVSWASGVDESSPAITSTENNQKYFVTWRHPLGVVDKPIKGQMITFEGTREGQAVVFSGVDADQSALIAGPTGDILAAWHDQPVSATNTDIFGQLVGNRFFIPVVMRNLP